MPSTGRPSGSELENSEVSESPHVLLKSPDVQQRGRKEQGSIESPDTTQSPQVGGVILYPLSLIILG